MSRASTDIWSDFRGRIYFRGFRGRTFFRRKHFSVRTSTPKNPYILRTAPKNPYYVSKVRPQKVIVRPQKVIIGPEKVIIHPQNSALALDIIPRDILGIIFPTRERTGQ